MDMCIVRPSREPGLSIRPAVAPTDSLSILERDHPIAVCVRLYR